VKLDTTSKHYHRLWFYIEDSDDKWDVPEFSIFKYPSTHQQEFEDWMAAKSEERRWRWSSCRYSRLDGTHHLPAGTVRGIPSLLKKDFAEVNKLGLFGESDLESILSEAGLSLENEDAQFTSWLARFNSGTTWAMEMRPRE
jgi:hypothetical protein